jgi:dihydrofolate reductase
MAAFWPNVGDDEPTAAKLNHLPKYVASTTLGSADWENTAILGGDVVGAVRRLKGEDGGELQVHGSGRLAQTLMRHGLIDVYELLVFPVVLGEGKRLFGEGTIPRSWRLTDHKVSPSGVLMTSYQRAGEVETGSVGPEYE